MSDIQSLNYCTHAIEDVLRMAGELSSEYWETTTRLRRTAQLLDQAVKFILPEHGDLIDVNKVDETAFDLMRLPFPLVALEAPFPPLGRLIESGPMKEVSSTRRIALIWDETFAPQSELAPDYKEPGIYVMAVYYTEDDRSWVASPVGLFMPRETEVRTVADGGTNAVERLAIDTLLSQEAITAKSRIFEVRYFDALPQMKKLLVNQMGYEVAQARLELDVRDEMLITWGFCLTVNCVNVQMATMPAPDKLNAKRIRNGKPPLYEYRVLQLPEARPTSGGGAKYRLEGIRQAPRIHLRRGHPRRLSDGRVTYVRAAVVGTAQAGVLHKDYRVRAKT
jgi:hypothetical protein